MSNVFFISDTHFFHKKILEFQPVARPFASVEEMNETLVDNWNSVVTKRDTVYHLGDVIFGGPKNFGILDRLKGNKKLIMGNHDDAGMEHYLAKFSKVEAVKKYDGYILSHVPVHPNQFPRFKGNVHGHLHSKVVLNGHKPDDRYVNVSCEQVNLTPIAWEQVKARFPE